MRDRLHKLKLLAVVLVDLRPIRGIQRSCNLVALGVTNNSDSPANRSGTRVDVCVHTRRRLDSDNRNTRVNDERVSRIRSRHSDVSPAVHKGIDVRHARLDIQGVSLPPCPEIFVNLTGTSHAEALDNQTVDDGVDVNPRDADISEQHPEFRRGCNSQSFRSLFGVVITQRLSKAGLILLELVLSVIETDLDFLYCSTQRIAPTFLESR